MKRYYNEAPVAEEFVLTNEVNFCTSVQSSQANGIEDLGSIDYDSDWE